MGEDTLTIIIAIMLINFVYTMALASHLKVLLRAIKEK